MQKLDEARVMWAWVDVHTGLVWTDGMASTPEYARRLTERTLGKRRMVGGEMRALRVTLTPLTADERRAHEAEYEAWRARRETMGDEK